jgi:hypothetical protein
VGRVCCGGLDDCLGTLLNTLRRVAARGNAREPRDYSGSSSGAEKNQELPGGAVLPALEFDADAVSAAKSRACVQKKNTGAKRRMGDTSECWLRFRSQHFVPYIRSQHRTDCAGFTFHNCVSGVRSAGKRR